MNHALTIKPHAGLHSELIIHPRTAAEIGINARKFAYVSFGHQRHYVTIKTDEAISPDDLMLSRDLIKQLHVPEYPRYEIALHQNEIVIGPCIGLLLSREERRLTLARLDKALIYIKAYAKLHGAIIVFALDRVDQKERLIEGYCYNPVKKYWQKGIFPYPATIYRTIGLNPEWKNHFLSVVGDRFFNNRFFNKWDTYRWLSKEPEIHHHIPETVLYHAPDDALAMLDKYPMIYIKPILGLQGRGIIRLRRAGAGLSFEFREHGVNRSIDYEDLDQGREYMKNRLRHGRYLIQQAVKLLEYQGGIIDFRCVLQKNQANLWVCKAIIGRTGVKESVVSNISSGGTAFPAERILRKTMADSDDETQVIKEKMAAFAIGVADKLDEYGMNCGTLGFDIGLEPSGHLWLIEINNRDPDPGIALDIRDIPLFYELKTGPLFYAKYLAGFQEHCENPIF